MLDPTINLVMQAKEKIFQTEVLIQVSDINYGGHLGNDRFLSVAQEVRVRWLRSHGWSEKDIDSSGAGFLVTEAHLEYHEEVFLGQTLVCKLLVGKCSKCSCELHYDFFEKESQKKVSTIYTKIAFFNYSTRKISKTPDAIVNLLRGIK